jgi:hypothetical protein
MKIKIAQHSLVKVSHNEFEENPSNGIGTETGPQTNRHDRRTEVNSTQSVFFHFVKNA